MIGAGKLGSAWRRLGCGGVVLPAMLFFALVFAPGEAAAVGPYEPNDTIPSAFGPLSAGQAHTGGIEAQGDLDYFFFYVTSPGEAQVTLTVRNLGGGAGVSNIDAIVLDSSATPVGGLSYINRGAEKTATLTLRPQKYFIEVRSTEGFGDTYSLTGGGEGAFGSYAQIAARCEAGMAATRKTQAGLTRAQAKLQRAIARLRRSLYGAPQALRAARSVHRKARSRVSAKREALKAAKRSRQPWCSIPQ